MFRKTNIISIRSTIGLIFCGIVYITMLIAFPESREDLLSRKKVNNKQDSVSFNQTNDENSISNDININMLNGVTNKI